MNAPLLLERYFFTKISLNSNPAGDFRAPNKVEARVEAGKSARTLDAAQESGTHYRVLLTVVLCQLEDKVPAYTGEFSVCGFFRVHPKFPAQECDQLVAVNGATMLYGAIREMVANLTARGPSPMVTLVALSFADLATPEKNEGASDAELGKAKSAHRDRKRSSPAEEGGAATKRVLANVMRKADPKA